MKKVIVLIIAMAPVLSHAQEIKPSVTKAEKYLRTGKLDEAKATIDATVGNQEYMTDKKGAPSKNAGKAWFLKALIYAGIDTTSEEKYKSLDPNPFNSVQEGFEKALQIDPKDESYLRDPTGVTPIPNKNFKQNLAVFYSNRGVKLYQDDKNYKKAYDDIKHTVFLLPGDTSMLKNAGVYFAPAAEAYDEAIEFIKQYLAKGGNDPDAYAQLITIYGDKKKDNATTLKYIQEARAKFPANPDYPRMELNIYLTEKKYDKAQQLVQQEIKKNPNDKESYYLLGGLNAELGKADSAKMAFQKCVDLDPTYFEASVDLAKMYYQDAKIVKAERDKLGITPKDIAKRKELFDELQLKYKIALPYWERCQKLKADDELTLYTLQEIYTNLVMDDKAELIHKKMKALGYSD
jgi:predicted Zn-dependent protease